MRTSGARALRVPRRFRRLRRRRQAASSRSSQALRGEGAVVLKGNHDQAIEKSCRLFQRRGAARRSNGRARRSSAAQKRFLAALPLIAARRRSLLCPRFGGVSGALGLRRQPVGRQALRRRGGDRVHVLRPRPRSGALSSRGARGRMRSSGPSPGTPIPVRGHRRWVAIVGSVGQPRDRNPAAAYTLFDPRAARSRSAASPTTRRPPPTRSASAACPASLAFRVELGI